MKSSYDYSDIQTFFGYLQSLDAVADSAQSYLRRCLVIFPTIDIMKSGGDLECPVVIIDRCATQFYFIKRLHERFHGDLGPNGLNELVQYLEDKSIPYEHIDGNTSSFKEPSMDLYVCNKTSLLSNDATESKNDLMLEKVQCFFQSVIQKCKSTISTAVECNTESRGTIAVNYGFTMNKCTKLFPTNALLDYHVPTHSNKITSDKEITFVLRGVNDLLIKFEEYTKNNGRVFGVKCGKWFHENENTSLSNYKFRFAKDMGIDVKNLDWRLYGCTLIIKSSKLKLHKDTLNGVLDNYSMAVVFSSLIESTALSLSTRKELSERLQMDTDEYLNMTVVVYGRHQIESLYNKYEMRRKICDQNKIVNGIINRVSSCTSWGYESWLHHDAKDQIHKWLKNDNYSKTMNDIIHFKSRLTQSNHLQEKENMLFKQSFIIQKSKMSKQLYWSSFVSTFYAMRLNFLLSENDLWEILLFMSTEVNGQCIVVQLFQWHILPMSQSTLDTQINKSGSMFAFLCKTLIFVINR